MLREGEQSKDHERQQGTLDDASTDLSAPSSSFSPSLKRHGLLSKWAGVLSLSGLSFLAGGCQTTHCGRGETVSPSTLEEVTRELKVARNGDRPDHQAQQTGGFDPGLDIGVRSESEDTAEFDKLEASLHAKSLLEDDPNYKGLKLSEATPKNMLSEFERGFRRAWKQAKEIAFDPEERLKFAAKLLVNELERNPGYKEQRREDRFNFRFGHLDAEKDRGRKFKDHEIIISHPFEIEFKDKDVEEQLVEKAEEQTLDESGYDKQFRDLVERMHNPREISFTTSPEFSLSGGEVKFGIKFKFFFPDDSGLIPQDATLSIRLLEKHNGREQEALLVFEMPW